MENEDPQVTIVRFLCMQVCVPADWTDDQASSFAERENPCGTQCGWVIRKSGDEALAGSPERMPCQDREGYVHIMLDA
jgi:hypothetical protein